MRCCGISADGALGPQSRLIADPETEASRAEDEDDGVVVSLPGDDGIPRPARVVAKYG
jgi:hypothetical protein